MLEVTFRRDSRNRLSSFFADGHAGFAAEGQDIVCAAVSAILLAARLGLESNAGIKLQVEQRKGTLAVRWPQVARDNEAVAAIVATAQLAVARIAQEHPAHVRCRNEHEA
ncbi:MAG: ribosomal-processing cysteine protease Prp [Bacillati bacterium]